MGLRLEVEEKLDLLLFLLNELLDESYAMAISPILKMELKGSLLALSRRVRGCRDRVRRERSLREHLDEAKDQALF